MNRNRYEAIAIRSPGVPRIAALRDDLDRLFGIAFSRLHNPAAVTPEWHPPMDVFEDGDNFLVSIELPGMKKEEIALTVENDTLTVSGERTAPQETGPSRIMRCERFQGRFQRTVALPKPVDGNAVTAQYTDGILTVTLPKAEVAKPRRIEVK